MKYQRIQVFLIALLIPCAILYWYTHKEGITFYEIFFPGTPVMHIGDIVMRVEIANSEAERAQGLSNRDELGKKANGMLFVFPKADYHGIWMKDMRFPIDIIWISSDLKVIGIDKDVTPDSYPHTYRPKSPAQYVVETEAKYTDIFGIHVGQEVRLPRQYLDN